MSYSDKDIAVITDFDGTISEKDVCYLLLEKYAKFDWKDIDEKWINGKFSTEDAYRIILSRMNLGKNELDALIEEVKIDRSFIPFALNCREKNIPLVIASDGLDYYINKILGNEGLAFIPVYANKLYFEGSEWIMKFSGADRDKCPRKNNPCGCCKVAVFEEAGFSGKKIVYAGDGISDRCAAESADYVFAKGFLKKYCEENKIMHYPFKTFKDIADVCINEIF